MATAEDPGGTATSSRSASSGLPIKAPSSNKDISIRVKNRRKRYLDLTPSYYDNPDLELADPLLYDRLVRRWQSAAEREAEGRKRGYSGRLEADLYRSEAKLAAVQKSRLAEASLRNGGDDAEIESEFVYRRGADGEIFAEDRYEEVPASKQEGWERWKYEMERRFLRGDDDDFEYATVDDNEAYDDLEEETRSKLESYLATESPSWDKTPEGETGIQDF